MASGHGVPKPDKALHPGRRDFSYPSLTTAEEWGAMSADISRPTNPRYHLAGTESQESAMSLRTYNRANENRGRNMTDRPITRGKKVAVSGGGLEKY